MYLIRHLIITVLIINLGLPAQVYAQTTGDGGAAPSAPAEDTQLMTAERFMGLPKASQEEYIQRTIDKSLGEYDESVLMKLLGTRLDRLEPRVEVALRQMAANMGFSNEGEITSQLSEIKKRFETKISLLQGSELNSLELAAENHAFLKGIAKGDLMQNTKMLSFTTGNFGFTLGMIGEGCTEAYFLSANDPKAMEACTAPLTDLGGYLGLGFFSGAATLGGKGAMMIPMIKNMKTMGPHLASNAGLALGSLVNSYFSKAWYSPNAKYLFSDFGNVVAGHGKAVKNYFLLRAGELGQMGPDPVAKWFQHYTGQSRQEYLEYENDKKAYTEIEGEMQKIAQEIIDKPKDPGPRRRFFTKQLELKQVDAKTQKYWDAYWKNSKQTFKDTFFGDMRSFMDQGVHMLQLMAVVMGISYFSEKAYQTKYMQTWVSLIKLLCWKMPIHLRPYYVKQNYVNTPKFPKALEKIAGFTGINKLTGTKAVQYFNFWGKEINPRIFGLWFSAITMSALHAARFLAVDKRVGHNVSILYENAIIWLNEREGNIRKAANDFKVSSLNYNGKVYPPRENHMKTYTQLDEAIGNFNATWNNRVQKLILKDFLERWGAWAKTFDDANIEHSKRINYLKWFTASYAAARSTGRDIDTTNGDWKYVKAWLKWDDSEFLVNNGEDFGGQGWHEQTFREEEFKKEMYTYLGEWNREVFQKTIAERTTKGMEPGKAKGYSDVLTPEEQKQLEEALLKAQQEIAQARNQLAMEAIAKIFAPVPAHEKSGTIKLPDFMRPKPPPPPPQPIMRIIPKPDLAVNHVTAQTLETQKRLRQGFVIAGFIADLDKRTDDLLKWAQTNHDTIINNKARETNLFLGPLIDDAFFNNKSTPWVTKPSSWLGQGMDALARGMGNTAMYFRGTQRLGKPYYYDGFFQPFLEIKDNKETMKWGRSQSARIRYNLRDTLIYQFKAIREIYLDLKLPDSNLTTNLRNALQAQRIADYEAHENSTQGPIDDQATLDAIVDIGTKTNGFEHPFAKAVPTTDLNDIQKADILSFTFGKFLSKLLVDYRSLPFKRQMMLGYRPDSNNRSELAKPVHNNGEVIDPFKIERSDDPMSKLAEALGMDMRENLKPLWNFQEEATYIKDTSDTSFYDNGKKEQAAEEAAAAAAEAARKKKGGGK